MAVHAYELYNSREFNVGKDQLEGTLEYIIKGSTDDAIARATMLAESPAVFPGVPGLVRGDARVRPIGGPLFYGTVKYLPDYAPLYPAVNETGPVAIPPAAPGLNTPLGADFAFDISHQTEHITQSKRTMQKVKRGGGVPPDTKRAIGVSADGTVNGCDRIKGMMEWSTTKTLNSITLGYIYKLQDMVGTTNNAPFYGGETGTQMFLGASGNTKDVSKCVVTFKFSHQKHLANVVITEDLIVPFKRGWDYLWVAYKNVADANKLTQQPDAAYVEQIYDEENFQFFGIAQ